MGKWTLSAKAVRAEVNSIGAMLGAVGFRLPGGRTVEPLKVAPWSQRAEAAALPPVMRYLGGEFACIPFGAPSPPPSAPDSWRRLHTEEPAFREVHGPSANAEWGLVELSARHIHLALDYPDTHPVARVERIIRLDDGLPAIELSLVIAARRRCRLAVGVHPIFDLGDVPRDAELELPFRFGRTFPGDYVPGASRLAEDARFTSLAEVPTRDGASLDLGRHPLATPMEDVVQLCDTEGWARLRRHSAGYAVSLRWDRHQFPSVVLGIANAGRTAPPFDGLWRALYIEPAATAFGMGSTIGSNPQNPIAQDGVATSIQIDPTTAWRTSYRIGVEAL